MIYVVHVDIRLIWPSDRTAAFSIIIMLYLKLNSFLEDLSQYFLTVYGTRGQCNLTKSASRGAHSPVRGHPRGSKVVPLNSWGRVSY